MKILGVIFQKGATTRDIQAGRLWISFKRWSFMFWPWIKITWIRSDSEAVFGRAGFRVHGNLGPRCSLCGIKRDLHPDPPYAPHPWHLDTP